MIAGQGSRFLAVLGTGFAAGVASGLLGVGGGIVIVPLLVWALGLAQHDAHATSLAAIVPIALAGAVVFHGERAVDLSLALPLAAGALLGAALGARLMRKIDAPKLRMAFGGLTIVVGVAMLLT